MANLIVLSRNSSLQVCDHIIVKGFRKTAFSFKDIKEHKISFYCVTEGMDHWFRLREE